ncbi:MAG: recombinase family protein [Phycisphaeraceae bacterium]
MTPTGQSIRYAIYTRQSVERPADFSSCDAQFTKCQSFIEQRQSENLVWVGVRFNDEGESGGTLDRPALTHLRSLVQSHGVDRIYVTALDRLARRVYDLIALIEEFEQAGVTVLLAQEINPPDGAQARFVRHLLGVFAEFERDMITARIAETRAYLKQHGRRIAGPAPFGYAPDPATKQLVVIPKEARRVRLIFQRAADGQTPSEIASRINHLKWRTKTWLSRRSNRQRGGGKWTARQVVQLLRNPVYIGRHRDPKGSRPGCHDPIVSEVLFAKVQDLLSDRRTVTNSKRHRKNFPLRGRIICPRCGRHLNPQISSKARGNRVRFQHRFYCCRSHAGGRVPCKGVRYPAHEVEQFVRSLLGEASTWRQLFPSESVPLAESLATTWMSLGHPLQNDLMPQIVESVVFKKKNTAMQITFSSRCVEVISRENRGF